MELTLWSLLPLVPLGLLAGLLSGLLGIGGGLIFSPLLLLLGLDPHQALATSSLAIVPTTLGGTWSHLRSRSLPLGPSLAIGLGADRLLKAVRAITDVTPALMDLFPDRAQTG